MAPMPGVLPSFGFAYTASWLDPFPPKVSAEVLGTLKKDFLSNYPAELLSADVLPGPRMLAWLRRTSNGDSARGSIAFP